jgi:hypothetical protein
MTRQANVHPTCQRRYPLCKESIMGAVHRRACNQRNAWFHTNATLLVF